MTTELFELEPAGTGIENPEAVGLDMGNMVVHARRMREGLLRGNADFYLYVTGKEGEVKQKGSPISSIDVVTDNSILIIVSDDEESYEESIHIKPGGVWSYRAACGGVLEINMTDGSKVAIKG